MNDPLDEIVSICTELRTVSSGMYSAYNCYNPPKQSDLFKLTDAVSRLDKVVAWIENNTPEVKQ